MKQNFFFSALLVSVAILSFQTPADAQQRKPVRKTHFVLATDPMEWSNGRANLCATGYIMQKIALCASADFQAGQSVQNNFLVENAQTGWSIEARLYPFGAPRQLTQMFRKREKGIGCPSHIGKKKVPRFSPLAGFYLAPGFAKMHQTLAYTPQFESLTPVFPYKIWQNSATLAAGFDLHIWRFTIGLRAQTSAGKAQWSGPVDIFGDTLNKVNYPFKLNVTNQLGFSVGINF